MEAFLEKREYDSPFHVWSCCYKDLKFLSHYHREMEIIYVREGVAHIGLNNHIYTCTKGDLILCQSGDMHYSTPEEEEENILDFIIFDPSILEALYCKTDYLKSFVLQKDLIESGMTEVCERMFYTVHNELKHTAKDYDRLIQLTLSEFWIKYCRHFKQPDQNTDRKSVMTSPSKIQDLMDYIDKNYTNDITLSDAARIMGYETCHCSKMFKKFTGLNFTEYLNTVKIGKAIEFIRKSDYNITQIAMYSGFNNIRSFNRVFKSITHKTPSDFMLHNTLSITSNVEKFQKHITLCTISYTSVLEGAEAK